MKVKISYEFDADVADLDPEFVDISGLAKDLALREMKSLLGSGDVNAEDFTYTTLGPVHEAYQLVCDILGGKKDDTYLEDVRGYLGQALDA